MISVFETMIRVVGGLLSAYELSAEAIFLTKAKHVADVLLHAFDSPSGIPYSTLDLKTYSVFNSQASTDDSTAICLPMEL